MEFKELYLPGDVLWYVKANELTGNKELVYGRVRSIYSKVIILTDENNNSSHIIDVSDAERIFRDEYSARQCFNALNLVGKYGEKASS